MQGWISSIDGMLQENRQGRNHSRNDEYSETNPPSIKLKAGKVLN
jgi:hypothetical protein